MLINFYGLLMFNPWFLNIRWSFLSFHHICIIGIFYMCPLHPCIYIDQIWYKLIFVMLLGKRMFWTFSQISKFSIQSRYSKGWWNYYVSFRFFLFYEIIPLGSYFHLKPRGKLRSFNISFTNTDFVWELTIKGPIYWGILKFIILLFFLK